MRKHVHQGASSLLHVPGVLMLKCGRQPRVPQPCCMAA